MSNESELMQDKLTIHNLTTHDAEAAYVRSLEAMIHELEASVASHLSSYHAPEAEEKQEEEHTEEEEKEEEDMSEVEEREPEETPKPKKSKADKPPVTDHFVFKRFTIGRKK